MSWGATHVLAYERDGLMVEELVRVVGSALYTVDEWTGHCPADWTLDEVAGGLLFQGVVRKGRCTLRPIAPSRLRLGDVLDIASRLVSERGACPPGEVARILGRSEAEVDRSLSTLRKLGKLPLRAP